MTESGHVSSPAVQQLTALPRFGTGVGLHRMRWVRAHSNAQNISLDNVIKVTGSKGKSTVATILDAIFLALGLSSARYTSPHLFDICERISHQGRNISPGDLESALEWTFATYDSFLKNHRHDRLSAFEAMTAAAFHYFSLKGSLPVIAECGIGGRYDATRAYPGGLAAITSIELEHTQLLGQSLELIAYDKIDALPDGGKIVLGTIDPELRERINAYCGLRSIDIIDAGSVDLTGMNFSADGSMTFSATVEGDRFDNLLLPRRGEHHARNAVVAIALAQCWLDAQSPGLRSSLTTAVPKALGSIKSTGYLELVTRRPDVYVDIAHTAQSAQVLAAAARAILPLPVLLVVGISDDRDPDPILRALAPIAERVICTRAYHKGMRVEALTRHLQQATGRRALASIERLEDAIEYAKEHAGDAAVLVAGGLFLASEARAYLTGTNPQTLRFLV